MNIFQKKYDSNELLKDLQLSFVPDIFFLFIGSKYPNTRNFIHKITTLFPNSQCIGCSTSGEIVSDEVSDNSVALTAVAFKNTSLKLVQVSLEACDMSSLKTGKELGVLLNKKNLRHVFVLSDGLEVNGAELITGLQESLDSTVSITGGLAGDGSDFKQTFVVYNNEIASKKVVALGLYGTALKIGFASRGGWDSFGIERLVTRSTKNIVYEIDGEPALDLYKSYLGSKAKDLPASGLLFPLSMRDKDKEIPVVRTILGIDEDKRSLTFAGNIPEGSYIRLMKANIDRIIAGAEQSAICSLTEVTEQPQLAILISCVGRKLVLKQLVEEEVEAVQEQLGKDTVMTGFYSYGEIAPFDKFSPCELHNQTMTITTLSE